ncbi:hypothetical protein ID871_09530 [Streptomyces pratensis]|uniref:Transmembrane protein n=2 Tax=Streptomyces TaxID=1883 RepID=A0A8D3WJI2_STRFA|nr:hypothetical protein F750_2256 [Streptomyces sp. PAMC 26508]MBD2831706.1 hypothetical protein [Streptomyces pratensis]MYT53219.1 hypothetical protein [Streptomyces sp. SID7815]
MDSAAMRSREFELDFRDEATKTRTWGAALLSLAAALWVWCAVLLTTSYQADSEPDDKYPDDCESRLFTDRGTANEGELLGDYCAQERDWPEVLAVLGMSVPVSVAGGTLFAIGTVSRRISSYGQAIRELDKLADRPKA